MIEQMQGLSADEQLAKLREWRDLARLRSGVPAHLAEFKLRSLGPDGYRVARAAAKLSRIGEQLRVSGLSERRVARLREWALENAATLTVLLDDSPAVAQFFEGEKISMFGIPPNS